MSYRKTPLVFGEYFHVYNRGNNKQNIFVDNKDRSRFVKLLYLSNSKKNVNFRDDIVDRKIDAWDFERGETLVSIGAWVLMPNHFHIYIISPIPGIGETKEDNNKENCTNVALFMNKLCVSYAKYFNKKHNRTGPLFEGRFKATHVDNDIQAKYLFSYIHLNPIKLVEPKWKENGIDDTENALNFLDTYKWNSYIDHSGIIRKENKILQLDNFPEYFSDIKCFESEIINWLQYKESSLYLV